MDKKVEEQKIKLKNQKDLKVIIKRMNYLKQQKNVKNYTTKK